MAVFETFSRGNTAWVLTGLTGASQAEFCLQIYVQIEISAVNFSEVSSGHSLMLYRAYNFRHASGSSSKTVPETSNLRFEGEYSLGFDGLDGSVAGRVFSADLCVD